MLFSIQRFEGRTQSLDVSQIHEEPKQRKYTGTWSNLSHTDNNESMIVRETQTNSPDRAHRTSPGLPIKKENLCSSRIAIYINFIL